MGFAVWSDPRFSMALGGTIVYLAKLFEKVESRELGFRVYTLDRRYTALVFFDEDRRAAMFTARDFCGWDIAVWYIDLSVLRPGTSNVFTFGIALKREGGSYTKIDLVMPTRKMIDDLVDAIIMRDTQRVEEILEPEVEKLGAEL